MTPIGWARLALRIGPWIAIAGLLLALVTTRSTLAEARADARIAAADARAGVAKAEAAASTRIATAADRYATSALDRQPIILHSRDTVTTYAQTPAGRASCLGADRVRGIDDLDAALFTPSRSVSRDGAVPAEPDAAADGR